MAKEELRALIALVCETRSGLRLSQEQVGLDGGLRRKYVGRLERGQVVPSVRGITGVAAGLGMTTAAFLHAWAERLEDGDAAH
jgi:transcriptional regulator with XRE-family HTH domain